MKTGPDRSPPAPITAAQWAKTRRVHLMGICGSAMSAFAILLKKLGFEVRGTDANPYPPASDLLAAHAIPILRGYNDPHALDWGPDLVIVGNVMRPDYPEVLAMRQRGLPHTSFPEALYFLAVDGKRPLVVTGTHGKTTTSSMLAWLLEYAGLAPSFLIGGITGNWASNHHIGSGAPFVLEGDEYDTAFWDKDAKFFHYRPEIASINNIEFDHADIFTDITVIEDTFTRFAQTLPATGRLVIPDTDLRALRAAQAGDAPFWRIGASPDAEIQLHPVALSQEESLFTLQLPDAAPLEISLPAAGFHNVLNAATAAAMAFAAGADPTTIPAAFRDYRLPLRRLTLLGQPHGVPIIDDFAHHPTAIRVTLDALRQRYPNRRLVALFEAQSNTARRRVFQADFAAALAGADRIYFKSPLVKASDPLAPEERLDLHAIERALQDQGKPAFIVPEIPDLEARIQEDIRQNDCIVLLSGRGFEGLGQRLVTYLQDQAPPA